MHQSLHLSLAEMEAQLDHIRQSPVSEGVLEMIVCRPGENKRQMLFEAELDVERGVIGDSWLSRGNDRGGPSNPECQVNIMNSRVAALVSQDRERWKLAGDQLYIDLDLSDVNLPPGSKIAIGTAILQVTAEPHTGCKKFTSRYGVDATSFVNSAEGKRLHLRGINAKIIQSGLIRTGDTVTKMEPS